MIWFKQYTIKDLNDLNKNTMGENLGLEFVEITEDMVIAKMPVDSRTVQPFRILHGGASAALAETLGSVASMMCLDVEKNIPVGIELNINHLRSESSGFVIGYCKPIRVGKQVHVWGIEIKNEQGKLVATSRLTTMVLEKK
jgi:1,4-dihydroxy-2-naphthoyl-CoA hydrolase